MPSQPADLLTAPTRASAAHTRVATPISSHDRAADVAARRIAQVDELFGRVSASFFLHSSLSIKYACLLGHEPSLSRGSQKTCPALLNYFARDCRKEIG